MARDKVGYEILLTASGHREGKDSTTNLSKAIEGSIPSKFRQATYEQENGCVCLSACLLIHSVNTKIATAIIERYAHDQQQFEWLDIFNRKNRSRQQTTTLIISNLFEQLCHVEENQYDLCKVKLHKYYTSPNLTDLILNEKKDGLFVALLNDENGNRSHTVGIDVGKQLI